MQRLQKVLESDTDNCRCITPKHIIIILALLVKDQKSYFYHSILFGDKFFEYTCFHDLLLHRPMSGTGRPLSGFIRPGSQGGRPGTMEQAIKTPRTAHTARPVTSASGRYVRLGTVSPCAVLVLKYLALQIYNIF